MASPDRKIWSLEMQFLKNPIHWTLKYCAEIKKFLKIYVRILWLIISFLWNLGESIFNQSRLIEEAQSQLKNSSPIWCLRNRSDFPEFGICENSVLTPHVIYWNTLVHDRKPKVTPSEFQINDYIIDHDVHLFIFFERDSLWNVFFKDETRHLHISFLEQTECRSFCKLITWYFRCCAGKCAQLVL